MDEKERYRYHYGEIVFTILVASILLRIILISCGGQYFWPDENRFEVSRAAAEALWSWNLVGFMKALHSADHFLFKVIGVVPATIQIIFQPSPKIPAIFFSLFSVANLWLGWGIVRRTGGSERAAILAISLLALCSTFFYYSRHLLPYDTAMAFGLLSIFVGLHKPLRSVDSILCGLFSAFCFLTYNGYWLLSVLAILVHILQPPYTLAKITKRGLISGISSAVPIASLLAISAAAGGHLLSQAINFSNTVTQGVYSEGWILPISFFWHAEHLFIFLWAAALLFGLWECGAGGRHKSVIFAMSAIIFIYGALVIFSVLFEKFVVMGRLARQLVPFCSILTALFIDRLWSSASSGKVWGVFILILALFQAILNFREPFSQIFPAEFQQLAEEAMVPIERGKYKVSNAYFIYPEPMSVTDTGRIILQRRHPLQFLPYQYEGYTPDQRSKLRSTDISMRLILNE